ncbi:5'-3' exonuclease [Actinoallomurus sp. NPDC050550]|uniref:5'-3' exonuclease n=1 Tax=Actinoallomurus sp. NPDC050550 TaxID=3154937 RepID=UPI003407BBB7
MGGLMLLDTPSLYFRAFFGVPESVTASDGTPVNAVRGLLDMIARLARDRAPRSLVACMDADWRPAFRVEALPSYKAHRVGPDGGDQTPDALATQVPVIEEVLDAFGIARIGAPGYEADDVIGTLATVHDGEVDVVTGDRDLFQLVRDDKPVRVLYTARGIKALQIVDEAEVTAKYGIPGRAYADYATLRGDPSDGLPGVPGVGDKTAAALITRFGDLEGIERALDEGETSGFPTGSRLKLEKARDYLAAARTVVRVETRIPIPAFDAEVPRTPRDPERLVALSERWSLDSPVNRLLAALAAE